MLLSFRQGLRNKHYQYTGIDDCTRLRVLRIYERLDQGTAIRFVDCVLEHLPFQVMRIRTDNRSEFEARLSLASPGQRYPTRLHPAIDAAAQRQSRALAPHRRRRVLSVAGRRGYR